MAELTNKGGTRPNLSNINVTTWCYPYLTFDVYQNVGARGFMSEVLDSLDRQDAWDE